MSRQTTEPLPKVARTVAALGQNIRLARQRRRITAQLLAERAGMSRTTLRAVERGDPSVTLGAVVNVLHSLGLERDLLSVAQDDELGRKLEDAVLGQRQRVRTKKAGKL